MDKQWYIYTMKYYSVIQKNDLSSHDTTEMNLKCVFLSERSQREESAYCMIPTLWHFGKESFRDSKKPISCQGLWRRDGENMNRWDRESFV